MENEVVAKRTIGERLFALAQDFGKLLKTKKFWWELFIMTAGMFVASIAVYFFLIPSKLIVGSITGLSLVIGKLFPILSVGNIIFVINAILLVLSFLLIGNEFGAKTVYTALILGPFIDLLSWLFPMQESLFSTTIVGTGQVIADPWFDLLCFVLILSASQAILFSINASTGGLDILAKIVNKYMHINLGTAVSIAGGAICCTAFLINDVGLVIIGLLGTWLNGIIVTYFMGEMSSKIRVYIITDEYEKIINFVTGYIHRGVTLQRVIGGYSKKEKMELKIILDQDDYARLIDFMAKENIQSFMAADKVSAIMGLWNDKRAQAMSRKQACKEKRP